MKKSIFLLFIIFGFGLVTALVFAIDDVPPASPRGFDAAGGTSIYEMVLTWTNPQDEDLDHIDVYLATSGGYIGSVRTTVDALPNTKGQVVLSELGSGIDYFLYLKAVDVAGNESTPTIEIERNTANAADTSSPVAITNFIAQDKNTDGEVILTWTNSSDSDFFQVHIYRATQEYFTPSNENEIITVFGLPNSEGSYTDTGLTNEQTYYYKIRTEDNRGNIQGGLFFPIASAIPTLKELEEEIPEETEEESIEEEEETVEEEVSPEPISEMTVEELKTEITRITALIAQLQVELNKLLVPAYPGCTITSFDRNLRQGISGDDVQCLQIILNATFDTQLAESGVGSPGNETTYFGPLTKAAVIKFQEKYASEVLTPLGLKAGTGFVGSFTRAKLNPLCCK
jgi:hypothetical protein